MSLMMLVFFGGLAALGLWLARAVRSDSTLTTATRTQSPDEVLAERFARGEIDEDDYTRRRNLLHTTGSPTHPTR